jgi:hypothetical protein
MAQAGTSIIKIGRKEEVVFVSSDINKIMPIYKFTKLCYFRLKLPDGSSQAKIPLTYDNTTR